jgi:hypothetical protein
MRSWSAAIYELELRAKGRDSSAVELDAAEMLVSELNRRNSLALRVESRPDPPDFLLGPDPRVAVEIKTDLDELMEAEGAFRRKLEARVNCHFQGSLSYTIHVDRDWVAKLSRRDKDSLVQKAGEMACVLNAETVRRQRVRPDAARESHWLTDEASHELSRVMGTCVEWSFTTGLSFSSPGVSFRAGTPAAEPDQDRDKRSRQWNRYAVCEYRRRVRKANCQLCEHARSGYETILLFDGRLSRITYGILDFSPEQLAQWHRGAAGLDPGLAHLSPFSFEDFRHIDHIVGVQISESGLEAACLWRSPKAGLKLPDQWTFLPQGWDVEP